MKKLVLTVLISLMFLLAVFIIQRENIREEALSKITIVPKVVRGERWKN